MSNAGLPSGFLPFGSLAHTILLIMRDYGPQSGRMLEEHLTERGYEGARHDVQAISANLGRMETAGFLVRVGSERRNGCRSAAVFYYSPCRPKEFQIRKLTGAERTASYHARKKIKVPSVFQFRARISLKESA